jgi:TctA family transporter
MNNIFIIAAIISVIFLIVKFIEMRYIEKESKPLKLLIRDALLVYFSVVMGYFILEQLKPVIGDENNLQGGNTPAFTDNPNF